MKKWPFTSEKLPIEKLVEEFQQMFLDEIDIEHRE